MAQSAAEKKRSEAAKKAAKTRKQNEQKAPQVDRQRSQPQSEESKPDEQAQTNEQAQSDEQAQQDAPVEVEQREVKEPTREQASQHSFQNDRENEKNLQRVAHNVRTGGGEVYENELEDQRDLHRRRTAFAA